MVDGVLQAQIMHCHLFNHFEDLLNNFLILPFLVLIVQYVAFDLVTFVVGVDPALYLSLHGDEAAKTRDGYAREYFLDLFESSHQGQDGIDRLLPIEALCQFVQFAGIFLKCNHLLLPISQSL